ncbi:MAG: hypothetical protein SPJ27_09060 [Candidatus Onthovivens sp.]|nr:hypothetical protein [Candidatus Onthovivens sp.]
MKDKLEPNMYVRIKWGNGLQTISKCTNKVDMGDTQYSNNDFYIHTDIKGEVIYKTMIVKSSFNIIDLVECGDYVNGYYVEDVLKTFVNVAVGSNYFQSPTIYEKDIKSIVTKESMESVTYYVK